MILLFTYVIQLVTHFENWRSVLFLLLLKVTIQVVVKVVMVFD